MINAMQCPCQPEKAYVECCGRHHAGEAVPTAEALMRSRYSAYVKNETKYLHKSWSVQTRPAKKALKQKLDTEWQSLTIIRTEKGTPLDSEGVVEFIAHYLSEGKEQQLHETSRFVRENGKWVYLDGNY